MHIAAAVLIVAAAQTDEQVKKISERLDKVITEYSAKVSKEIGEMVKDEVAKLRGGAADGAGVEQWNTYLGETSAKLVDDGVSGDLKKACSDKAMRNKVAILLANSGLDPKKAGERLFEMDEKGAVRVRKEAEDGVKQVLAAAAGGAPPVRPQPAAKPYLGFSADNAFSDDDRKAVGLDPGEGVRVGSVAPDGPADKAAIKVGDIVLSVNGKDFGPNSSREIVAALKAGQKVNVVIFRDKTETTVEMTVGARDR